MAITKTKTVNPLQLVAGSLLKNNLTKFIQDAIKTDGRGNFLASYDSQEYILDYKKVDYYVYRIN
jgi:hypothetical protein